MDKLNKLKQIFRQLRRGEVLEQEILELKASLGPADTTWIMEYVETLGGPQVYMDDLDECDESDNAIGEKIATGFFLFIDLVSLLILNLGDDAIEKARCFENSESHYAPYVLKYCTDPRFTKGLGQSFPFLKT